MICRTVAYSRNGRQPAGWSSVSYSSRRLGFSYCARLVALAYFNGNALQIANAINGLESALAVAAVLAVFFAFLHGRRDLSDRRSPWLFGLLSGVAILARTDHVLLVGVLLLAILRPALKVSRLCAWRWLLATAGSTAALFLPWAIFSYATVGTVVQSSGIALPLVHNRMQEVWGFAADPWLRVEQALAATAEAWDYIERFVNLGPVGLSALLVLTGSAAAVAAFTPGKPTRYWRQCALLVPLAAALLVIVLVHATVRLCYREWYTASLGALAALLVGLVADWAARRFGSRAAALGAVLLLAWPLYSGYRSWRTFGLWMPPGTQFPWGPEPRPHTAHTDCGGTAYYATYGVTNLDGIANQRALDALRERRLLDYIKGQRFTYFDLTFQMQAAAFMGPRYRESVISIARYQLRVVSTPAEKDAKIAPMREPIRLGTVEGRELLSDGWIWPLKDPPAVRSIGPYSELIFYLPSTAAGGKAALIARAVVVDHTGRQPVDLFLNAERVAAVAIGPGWEHVNIPLARARAGRNRLRLEYGAPRAIRDQVPYWYRDLQGNPLSAIQAAALSLTIAEQRSSRMTNTRALSRW